MKRRLFFKQLGLGALALPSIGNLKFEESNDKIVENTKNNENKGVIYSSQQQIRNGIAMGGIGTGSIEMRADGNFHNWSIFNNYPKNSGKPFTLPSLPNSNDKDSLLFFIVKYKTEGQDYQLKLLQINNSLNEGGLEAITYYYPWMSCVDTIEFSGNFPFVNINYKDDEMPFDIELEAFSPFIPHHVKESSLPGVYFNFKIVPKTKEKIEFSILGSLRNLVAYDTTDKYFVSKVLDKKNHKGFVHTVGGVDEKEASFGEMGLTCLSSSSSYYLGWEHKHPYYERLLVEERLPNIDDTANRNKIINNKKQAAFKVKNVKDQRCFSTVADHTILQQEAFNTSFLFSWNFPNAQGSIAEKVEEFDGDYVIPQKITNWQGHYYSNFFNSYEDVHNYMIHSKNELERKTQLFNTHFYDSSLPKYVLNQINAQFNTFITSSTFTKDGKFAIREGMSANKAWGPNGTIDVSLYGSIMILSLFPELQKSLMRIHKNVQTDNGEIAHGLANQLDYTLNGTWGVYHRLDLVPNYIQMVLRDYLYTNDQDFLDEIWPSVVKGIDYILKERDKNNDEIPEMEGIMCSYDNFPMFGHASYIVSQWACALKLASIVAKKKGDNKRYRKYKNIADKSINVMENKLWNGKYFRLYNDEENNKKDEGCLTDQVIGQWTAHLAGIDSLLSKEKINSSLMQIYKKSFNGKFLRNCSWPEHPKLFPIEKTNWWVDQANTPWSGVELAFASLLYYEGFVEQANTIIKAVDHRYKKAGLYWNHQEYGGHYYRPMSAWSIINGALGYSVQGDSYTFKPKLTTSEFKLFFTACKAWAHFKRSETKDSIAVSFGEIIISSLVIENTKPQKNTTVFLNNTPIQTKISKNNNSYKVKFKNPITIKSGSILTIVY